MPITPKSPNSPWLESYLLPGLLDSPAYKIDAPKVDLKIDQNESPFDWPVELKEKVCQALMESAWNRYPEPYPKELESLVAKHVGVSEGSVLLSPGSNHLIALVLSIFGPKASKVVLARPSFPLYESHCKCSGIPYEPWTLNSELEYDVAALPDLPPKSLVLFASPNNPVGNILPRKTLRELLTKYPETLFIGDEAYLEFASEPYTELLSEFSNLMLIRTFSKTMGAAGIRLGYLVAAPEFVNQVRKLMLPFLINRLTLAAVPLVLEDVAARNQFQSVIDMTITERDRLAKALSDLGSQFAFQVKNSQANFLLVRFASQEACMAMYHHLVKSGILVRNISGGTQLTGCLRVTVGTPAENTRVIETFRNLKP